MLEVQDGGLKQISDMDRGLRHVKPDASSLPRVFPSWPEKLPGPKSGDRGGIVLT